MICRFCNKNMISKDYILRGISLNRTLCNNHKQIKVIYRQSKDYWRIIYKDYVLCYYDNKTLFQKINKKGYGKNYYQLIKKFDYELPFLPEDFPNKLKTMLTFL